MVTEVKLDHLSLLEAKERHGTVRRLVRTAQVSFTGIISDDWDVLMDALDAAGIPSYGSVLDSNPGSTAYGLTLIERNPSILDKNRVQVELVYENTVDTEQSLDAPFSGYALGQVRANIQQVSSNLDASGNQVSVSHTYPEDDPNHAGETLTQGGEFQYYDSQRTINIRGIKITRTPWLLANKVVGKVNELAWSGEAMRTWLCTACSWKAASLSGGSVRYFMDFEFQFNPDTWDPTVVFIDDVTGKPPPGLVADTGFKTVTKMGSADFDRVIGTPIQGA